ncbi:MAG TPA: hypothetical protein VFV66_12270 [Nonomuraea sp.]|nr:hypothetical protein [Nonomuraea sp.]
MDKRPITALAAAASGLLLIAGAAAASSGKEHTAARACSDRDYIKINVSPPPPLAGAVQTEDIGKLLKDFAAGKVPLATPTPTPTPPPTPQAGVELTQEMIDWLKKACSSQTPIETLDPAEAMRMLADLFDD